MALDDLVDIGFAQRGVPGPRGVDDGVGAVLAEAEALDGIYSDGVVHADGAQLVLERSLHVLRAALFAAAALADEHVGVMGADLRARLWQRRYGVGRTAPLRGLVALLFRHNFPDPSADPRVCPVRDEGFFSTRRI